jgi:hypothetical protein
MCPHGIVLCVSLVWKPAVKIHRVIGMSAKLFLPKLLKELGHRSSPALVSRLESARAPLFARLIPSIATLPGASELLTLLRRHKIPLPSQRAATAPKRGGFSEESPSSPTVQS